MMGNLQIIQQTDPGYEAARVDRQFNMRVPDRFPLGVIKITEEDQIVQAVKLAAEKGCRIAVRSGGHSWASWALRGNSILLDLGDFHEMELDEETGIVRVSASTTGGELSPYLRSKGRMFCGGHCPDVALGGFLLQGGVGWNARGWGWACEQVVAIDAVTADGQLVRADESQNPDLYWAARGSGPGFPGVVTRFHLKTRPLSKAMRSSTYVYPVEAYREVFEWILQLAPTFDIDTEIVMISCYPPGLDQICIVASFLSLKSSEAEAEAALRTAEASHPEKPLVHLFCQETSLEQEYISQRHANPAGHRYYCDNAFINNDEDVPTVLEKALTSLPSKEAYSFYYPMNPWSRKNLPDMAISLQCDHYIAMYTIWKNKEDDERCITWVKDVIKGIKPYSCGSYIGDLDLQSRTTRFWGEEQGKRLMDIRRQRDPKGVICGYLDVEDKSGPNGLDNQLDRT
ncbi:unnamed protein product [Clonostachys solani]|uniref:FAD-binding PCMH-type domain-containing protein n=1 Tax=Clonostachys solani TaxID=160281 RepID=A0A9P0EHB1_9HYPO|nr:unnamed protein product [Clonostachys solani]